MKIIGFSSIRSDYDIMSSLYRMMTKDNSIDFRIVVSGAHISDQYGNSISEIEKDGINILAKVNTLHDIQKNTSRIKSSARLLLEIVDIINDFHPDFLIYAGDREDVLIYAMIGAYLNIPTIHFYAGDHGIDGYVDNPIRHATSKLSTFCFVSLKEHKNRLIAMGENAQRIHVIGNISLDNFIHFNPFSKNKIFSLLNVPIHDKFALLIFHPITSEIQDIDNIFKNILCALKQKKIFTFVSSPNTDYGSHKLLSIIAQYQHDCKSFFFYKNLDRNIFLSIYKNSLFIIGNSSSGICESASIPIPAINVGMRQLGRQANRNVIFCGTSMQEILSAIQTACSSNFLDSIKKITNCYGSGNSAQKAFNIIKQLNPKPLLAKKEDPYIKPKQQVLIISTHPDDETLGAGGTILRHIAQGDDVHCVFCTDILEEEGFSQETISTREQEIIQMSQAYGFTSTHRLGLKTMRVDEYSKSELIKRFSKIFQEIQPNIVYLPFCHDVHSDHRCIFEAAFSCTKSFRYPSVQRVLMMETLSETEFAPNLSHTSFIPNVFVDITEFIEKKCEIMQIYKSEIAPPPFPRSIENIKALALYRGSTMGDISNNAYGGGGLGEQNSPKYAESFMLLKEKW
ncbi:UDP-N-acetylglucosamine 2-epimerase [Helicobacter pametensis]|uniref:UDP-N-acetylglucosamine 2-epimerase n=1 Tax=Helicobacter pametensis TaxID=95149 RepID=UPI0004B01367|nr:UDP-N-acetylglucosamine 2-epimerase [Helicobacter pametensis]